MNNFKFGVIYQRVGQTTEEALFGNRVHSPAMERFMDSIGNNIHYPVDSLLCRLREEIKMANSYLLLILRNRDFLFCVVKNFITKGGRKLFSLFD